ncbi:DUF1206 domain-containing protein [uncultured Sphingomonas sp.]|uniref:DUF1206 domain-containing protein n=1 Tax=uncultured Sphingomonas sp. TaxID=158754 RepID=UPI0035CB63CB
MTASTRLTLLTRIGFATRGLLYIVIALLVIRTGRSEDTSGALRYLGQGGGQILLGIMAAGLIAYGLWRLADAAFDIEHHGTDRKGALERAGAGISGVVHLLLAWQAIQLMRGTASASDGTQDGAQAALALPGGQAILIAAGLILLAVGVVQLVKAAKGSFLRYLEPQIASQAWARWSGRAGYAARGVVFLISSVFILRAGLEERASEAGGTAAALSWLTSPVDIIIAIGLFAFGLFSLIEARFRQLHDVPIDRIVAGATGGR